MLPKHELTNICILYTDLEKKIGFQEIIWDKCCSKLKPLGNRFLNLSITQRAHHTSNQRRFDVDITSIPRRPNFDQFPRHSHVLFRCNFADRKIHVVSTYFFRSNFSSRKIHAASTYFFRNNLNFVYNWAQIIFGTLQNDVWLVYIFGTFFRIAV